MIGRCRVEARQNVRQIRKGIDFVGDARGDDGVEGGEVFARVLVPVLDANVLVGLLDAQRFVAPTGKGGTFPNATEWRSADHTRYSGR